MCSSAWVIMSLLTDREYLRGHIVCIFYYIYIYIYIYIYYVNHFTSVRFEHSLYNESLLTSFICICIYTHIYIYIIYPHVYIYIIYTHVYIYYIYINYCRSKRLFEKCFENILVLHPHRSLISHLQYRKPVQYQYFEITYDNSLNYFLNKNKVKLGIALIK